MTMVTTSGEREAILPMMSDCACAEKPRPPCSFEMSMPRKPRDLTKSQILLGDLALRVAHLPVVDEAAQLLGRAVEERLLLGGEDDWRDRAQLVPIGCAGEQLRIKADSAGFQRLRLRVGDLRQRASDELEHGRADVLAANGGDSEHRERGDEQPKQKTEDARMPVHRIGLPDQRGDGERAGPSPEGRLVHTECEDAGQKRDAKQKLSHTFSLRGRILGGRGTRRNLTRRALRWR